MSLSFDFPLPTNRLRANFRGHSRQKAGAVSAAAMLARETAKALLTERGMEPPHWSRVRIEYVFSFRARNQMQDSDNAVFACKPYLDGLKDWITPPAQRKFGQIVVDDPGIPGAGVITDDKGAWPLVASFRIDSRNPRVTITLTPY